MHEELPVVAFIVVVVVVLVVVVGAAQVGQGAFVLSHSGMQSSERVGGREELLRVEVVEVAARCVVVTPLVGLVVDVGLHLLVVVLLVLAVDDALAVVDALVLTT